MAKKSAHEKIFMGSADFCFIFLGGLFHQRLTELINVPRANGQN